MLRLKYYSLTKEEKYKLKEEFYLTNFGKITKQRLSRLFITGIIGIIYSIYLFFSYNSKWDIVTGIILLLASILFIGASNKIRITKLNNFLISKNK